MKSKKLLVIGNDSIHMHNFIELVQGYFDDVLFLTSKSERRYTVETMQVDFSLRKNGLTNYFNLKKIIEKFVPTHIHIHQVNTAALLSVFTFNPYSIPIILTAWGSDILQNPQKNIFERWKVQYILNRVSSVTADSDTVLQQADKLVSKVLDTHNINFGIEIPNCTTQKENIIYSNRLHKKLYNIDKIIISFNRFVKKDPSWKLVIAGSGEETERLKRLVETLNLNHAVEFIGWVDSTTNCEYYCKAKIYVSIPQSDSISISLVEAIASSCVVFVSDLPANREVYSPEIGYIVKELEAIDFESFEAVNAEKFQSKRERLVENFSKEVNQQRYYNLYERYQ